MIVEGIKEVNEIANGETCRRGWRRPVIEIWGNAHLAVEGEQSMKTEQSVRLGDHHGTVLQKPRQDN